MAAECKDCGIVYWGYYKMVMLKDSLWVEVCDDWLDCLCSDCIEVRMGRKIQRSDFKGICLPCNEAWFKNEYI